MTYGAKESNSKEGMGLALFIAGLVLWVAGWAYWGGIVQVILIIVGIAAFIGGFWVLKMARGTA